MNVIWQYIGVGLLVVLATVYLICYYARRRRAQGLCDHCPVRSPQADRLPDKAHKSH